MNLEFYGAADDVTGSLHRIHLNGKDVLLDCGMLQGQALPAHKVDRLWKFKLTEVDEWVGAGGRSGG